VHKARNQRPQAPRDDPKIAPMDEIERLMPIPTKW
jgi:hypothetical protein